MQLTALGQSAPVVLGDYLPAFSFSSNYVRARYFEPEYGEGTPIDALPLYSFSTNYVRARYFEPEYTEGTPSVTQGPRMRGFLPGRTPGLNSGLLF